MPVGASMAFQARVQAPTAPQDVRRGRAALRAQEVDPLLRGCDLHHLHRGTERLRHGAGGGRRSGGCQAGPECFQGKLETVLREREGSESGHSFQNSRNEDTRQPAASLRGTVGEADLELAVSRMAPGAPEPVGPGPRGTAARAPPQPGARQLLSSSEPHAREPAPVQQHLQPPLLRHHVHCALPQQEGRFLVGLGSANSPPSKVQEERGAGRDPSSKQACCLPSAHSSLTTSM